MDKQIKKFLYVGKERCDVLYFLVKLIANTNKNVLVIDNSKRNDFFEIFSMDESDEEIRKDNIVVAKNVILTNELLRSSKVDAFDFVFVYLGLNTMEMEFDIDALIVAPAAEPYEIRLSRMIAAAFNDDDIDTIIIPRDKVDNSYSKKGFVDALELNANSFVYPMEFDASTYATYVSLLHNKDITRISFKKAVNEDMIEFLNDFGMRYLGLEQKEMKQLLK